MQQHIRGKKCQTFPRIFDANEFLLNCNFFVMSFDNSCQSLAKHATCFFKEKN